MSNSRQPGPLPSLRGQPSNPGSSVSANHRIPQPNHNRFGTFCKFKKHTAAAIALITLAVTVVTLLPSFWGATYAKEALELARWTARKDYIEACQEVSNLNMSPALRISISDTFLKYLNGSSIRCQQALEDELPPPPGLNGIQVRSLEDLQLKILMFRIESPDKGRNHIPLPLRRWLLVGMGLLALVMTCKLAGCRRLMRTARTSFGLLARHLGADSRSLRPLVENHTSEGDFGHSEPITSRIRRRDPALDSSSNEPASKTVARAMASGNDQGNGPEAKVRPVYQSVFSRRGTFLSHRLPSHEMFMEEQWWPPPANYWGVTLGSRRGWSGGYVDDDRGWG